jgi:subtilisin family serine protease
VESVTKDKFKSGVQGLADEWQKQLASLRSNVLLAVAMHNCIQDENDDADGIFFYPGGLVVARGGLGVSYTPDATMITVTSVDAWDTLTQTAPNLPALSQSASFGTCEDGSGNPISCTVKMAAPGSFWRLNDAQTYLPNPPTTLGMAVTACGGGTKRCEGTSFAAPLVAAAAVLTLANHPNFSAADLTKQLLDTARDDLLLARKVERRQGGTGGRLLNIQAAVQ